MLKNWKFVFFKFIGAYLLSFLSFLPGKKEHIYNLDNHIQFWLYAIIFFYILISTIFFGEKIILKLTEGITLLLSLSLAYWVIDYGFINVDFILIKILLIVGLLFAIYSILHSITYIPLTRTARLVLSIWSSIIIFTFSIDNIFRVFTSNEIENSEFFSEGLYVGIQYFLLGISSIYILQNFILLTDLLPSKNSSYKKDLILAKKAHIKRFSNIQVARKNSLICILYCFFFYYLNSQLEILPRHTMIWFVIFTFPIFVNFLNYIQSVVFHKKITY